MSSTVSASAPADASRTAISGVGDQARTSRPARCARPITVSIGSSGGRWIFGRSPNVPVCRQTASRPRFAAAGMACQTGKFSHVISPSGTPGRVSFRSFR